jgi:pheromone shutdown protein TraB
MIVLGDRLYSVTIQRIFDKLTGWEKLKMVFIVLWEALTMSIFKIKDYIRKTEDDSDFVRQEVERFSKYMPSFAEVIIHERDEYIAQSLHNIARIIRNRPAAAVKVEEAGSLLPSIDRARIEESTSARGIGTFPSRSRLPIKRDTVVAVVGAGHLLGIQRHLGQGVIHPARLHEIASSSKQASTWPGEGTLHVVNTDLVFHK